MFHSPQEVSAHQNISAEQRELIEYRSRLARRVRDIEQSPDGNE